MPDVDGDREHGIQTLSIALGKEKVCKLIRTNSITIILTSIFVLDFPF